ncbi:MAG: 1-acyl-sn-glycerol-3-phosphate acyltransferase [Myxococcota bacterium]
MLRGSRLGALRLYLMLVAYFWLELAGILAAGWVWLWVREPERFLEANFRLQRWWVRSLFGAGAWLFRVSLEVERPELASAGPMLLFVRHVSVVDALLPTLLVSDRADIRLRFVLKAALLFDPCLDVVGQRLANVFVRRGREVYAQEVEAVAALASNLGPRDGVIVFPEGTRFSPEARARILAQIAERQSPEAARRAEELVYVLPPRVGGIRALLGRGAPADVVILAHTGLEEVRRLPDLWNGTLVGRRIALSFWREPAASVPKDEAAALLWFHECWKRVDAWVAATSGRPPAGQR